MIKCRNCRTEIDDDMMFCPECGTRVERDSKADTPVQFCPNCGTKAEAGAEFCGNCGQRLKETVREPEAAPEPASVLEPASAPSAESAATLEPVSAPSAEAASTLEPASAPSAESASTLELASAPSAKPVTTLESVSAPSAELAAALEPASALSAEPSPTSKPASASKPSSTSEPSPALEPAPALGPPHASTPLSIPTPVEQKKRNFRVPLIIGGAVAAVAFLAVGIFAVPKAVRAVAGMSRGNTQEVFYIKGRGLYGASLKNPKKKPVEYTDHFADSPDDAVSQLYNYRFVSKDGKYHFYMEDLKNNEEMSYTLYCQKGTKDPVKIDSKIQGMYQVTDDNQVVYIKNDNLYVSDLKDTTKIGSDVEEFMLDKAGKNVLWMVDSGNEEGGCDIYYQDLAKKKDKKKLISDGWVLKASSDLNTLLILKEGAIYLVRNQGDREKLADDVDYVLAPDLEAGTFFYVGRQLESASAMDFVDDDMAAADARITEPKRSDYERTEEVGQGYWAYTRTVVDDRYYEELERFDEKTKRDSLRKELSGMTIDMPYQPLYYFSNGEAQLITDKFVDWSGYPFITEEDKAVNPDFTSYLLYQRANDTRQNKVKLSELSYAQELESMLYFAKENDVVNCLFAGGKETELDLDGKLIYNVSRDVKNNQLYCHLAEQEDYGVTGDLVSFSLNGENAGKMEKRDSDVNGIELVSNGNVYYMKDVNDWDVGDLYCNGEQVATDVGRYSVVPVPDSSAVLYVTDPDHENGDGSLIYLKGRNAEKIADDVSDYHALGEKQVVLLTDYNYNRHKGELKYYDGRKLRDLDSDVRGFFY